MKNNIDKLVILCNFFRKASLEEDMAKRIMLSIIPSVMSKTEMHHSGGFDYKALKSAVHGAKDLVKYGARACLGELVFYGNPLKEKWSELSSRSYRMHEISEEKYKQFKELKELYDRIKNTHEVGVKLDKEGNYKELLKLCTDAFKDLENWDSAYGGTAWAKISDTLYQIEEKRGTLNNLHQKAIDPKSDPKMDYLGLEVNVMKEIIVLMNIFDGLAHNNGSVMPKVVQEELSELQKKAPYASSKNEHLYAKYQKRIQELMDSKEVDDPMTIYKEIQSIIEEPRNRHIFGDWITKIRNSPDYHAAKNMSQRKNEMDLIKTRKMIKSHYSSLDSKMNEFSLLKDSILNAHDDTQKRTLFVSMKSRIKDIRDNLEALTNSIHNMAYDSSLNVQLNSLYSHIKNSKLQNLINNMIERLYDSSYGRGTYFENNNELISDTNTLKRLINSIPSAIDQYIG